VDNLATALLWNVLEATLLALGLACALRLVRLTAPLRHVLWLLVLLKLLFPPVLVHPLGLSAGVAEGWSLLQRSACRPPYPEPALSRETREPFELRPDLAASDRQDDVLAAGALPEPELPQSGDPNAAALELAIEPNSASSSESVGASSTRLVRSLVREGPRVFALAWLAGSVAMAIWQAWRVVVLFERLRGAEPVSSDLQAVGRSIARSIGLTAVPRILAVPSCESPMVCCTGRPTIVLPRSFCGPVPADVLRGVLAHELAHIQRRDHWVCWIELLASSVYWWVPTFWTARRALRRAADEAADAWAVQAVGSREAYAESLLGAVEYLRVCRLPVPVLGRSLGEREAVARRLTMIMRDPLCFRLSYPARLGALLLGLVVLPTAPQRLQAQPPPEPPGVPSSEGLQAALGIQEPEGERGRGPGEERELPRPPDRPEQPRAVPPAPASPRGRGETRAPRGPEQRLRELEEKMDRVLNELRALRAERGGREGPHPPTDRPGEPGHAPGAQDRAHPPHERPDIPDDRRRPGAEDVPRGRGPFGLPPGAPEPPSFRQRRFGREGRDLRPEQRERIEAIHREVERSMREIQEELARVQAEFRRRLADLERQRDERIREILSAEPRERPEPRREEPDRPAEP
jgi:beta-lactamase regulating signal transducer with metallopeptidase domain